MAEENTINTIFKADISQFSASTQQLNTYIKTVNSEFNLATASMGKWSDSTDGLQAKITQLNRTLEAEKMKLANLESALAKLQKEGKGNTKQAQQLQIAINNQKSVVAKTEKQTDEYTKSLKELQKAGVNTKQELKELTDAQNKQGDSAESVAGKIAKGLGGAIAGIATACAGAVTGFLALGESTREFRKEQAQLETAFTQAGHSVDTMKKTYSEFNAILGDTSKSQETLLHLAKFTKSEQELADYTHVLTGVFAEFGASLPTESLTENINLAIQTGDAIEGGLADALEWGGVNLDEFKKKLASCSTEEQRSQLILGKLTELYGESAEAYKQNNKDIIEAEKAQTRLTQAMADLGAVAEPIMTMLKNLAGDLLIAIKPFVELLGTGLKGAFEGSAEGAEKFAEGLTGIINTLLGKVTELLPTLVDMFLKLIPTLTNSLLSSLPSLVATFAQIMSQIVGALGEMIPQIVGVVIEIIPQIVQALVDAMPVLLEGAMQFWEAIIDALPDIIDKLVTMLPQVIETIISGLHSYIDILINGVLPMLPQLITAIVDALVTFIPQLLDGAITLFMAIVEAIPIIIEALIPQLPTIIDAIIDGLLKMLPVLLQGAIKLLMAIIDALPTIIKLLIKEVPKIVKTIIDTLLSRLPDLITGAIQLLMGILEAIPTICIELLKNLPEIITTICEGLMEGLGDIMEVGVNLIKGLWDGIKSAGEWLWGKVKDFGSNIVGWFEDVFKINSPSKVFEDKIGKNIALGIGEGFNDEIGDVAKSMTNAFEKVTPDISLDANANISGTSAMIGNNSLFNQLIEFMNQKPQNVVNNYKFDYTFEGMETTQFALHKAQLETKRLIGG